MRTSPFGILAVVCAVAGSGCNRPQRQEVFERAARWNVMRAGAVDSQVQVWVSADESHFILTRHHGEPLLYASAPKRTALLIGSAAIKPVFAGYTAELSFAELHGESVAVQFGHVSFNVTHPIWGPIEVARAPHVLGSTDCGRLVLETPELFWRYRSFTPSAQAVDKLRIEGQGNKTRVSILFGSWCQYSRETVPKVLRTLADAGLMGSATCIGIGMPVRKDSYAQSHGVIGVPALVIEGTRDRVISGIELVNTPEQVLIEAFGAGVAVAPQTTPSSTM